MSPEGKEVFDIERIVKTEKGQLDEEELLKMGEQEPSTLRENEFIKEAEKGFVTKKRKEFVDPWEDCYPGINEKEISQFTNVLGCGRYGTIFGGYWQGKPVVIKAITFAHLTDIETEVTILK